MLTMSKLGFILKSLNHNFRYRVGNGRQAMLYVYQPLNKAGEPSSTGLIDVCAFPSPKKYPEFPKFDFLDYTGRKSRGYTQFFQILVSKKLISPGKLSQFVPDWRDQPKTPYVTNVVKPKLKTEVEGVPLTSGLPKGFVFSGK